MFLILTLVILLISILFFYPAIRRFLKMKETFNKIPGPKPYPIIGNLLETATLKKEGKDVFSQLKKQTQSNIQIYFI